MRAVLLAACAIACGRVGFAPHDTAGSSSPSAYRTPLTIPHSEVAGDLADFPVLVALDDAALASHAAADGHDLAFVDASGAQLAYELESYSAAPAHLVAWVKQPAVSAATDTTFYVTYGAPGATSQAQPRAVWSNGYVGVYHFGASATLDARDSTGVNDGTIGGGASAVSAVVGGGLAVSGAPAVSAPTAGIDSSPGALDTVTLWVDYTGPVGKSPVGFLNGGRAYDLWFQTATCTGFNTEQGDVLGTTQALTGRWVYLAIVFYNGMPTPRQSQLYVDGQVQTLTRCAAPAPLSYTVGGTVVWGGDPGYEMTGSLDEARIAVGARSAAWIATEYANQSAPSRFVIAGPEETAP